MKKDNKMINIGTAIEQYIEKLKSNINPSKIISKSADEKNTNYYDFNIIFFTQESVDELESIFNQLGNNIVPQYKRDYLQILYYYPELPVRLYLNLLIYGLTATNGFYKSKSYYMSILDDWIEYSEGYLDEIIKYSEHRIQDLIESKEYKISTEKSNFHYILQLDKKIEQIDKVLQNIISKIDVE